MIVITLCLKLCLKKLVETTISLGTNTVLLLLRNMAFTGFLKSYYCLKLSNRPPIYLFILF